MSLVIGIDATNLRSGGTQAHLIELLSSETAMNSVRYHFIVWGLPEYLRRLPNVSNIEKVCLGPLFQGWLTRTAWQRWYLSRAARSRGCDVLFVPGGAFAGDFQPVVVMSQNLLPFDAMESARYKWHLMRFKLFALRAVHSRAFSRANGIIFLTQHAKATVQNALLPLNAQSRVIPHGISPRFTRSPAATPRPGVVRPQSDCRILYVSTIDAYKHPWNVVEAVAAVRGDTNLDLSLTLVGSSYPPAARRLQRSINLRDPEGSWVSLLGPVSYEQMHEIYEQADIAIFASTCENLPIILLEKMAAGLPIASSDRSPMPEILGDAGIYFNSESVPQIALALTELIRNAGLRQRLSTAALERSGSYRWERCARETFEFLEQIAGEGLRK